MKDIDGSHAAKMNEGSPKPLFNFTLYAENNKNYDQDITIRDSEKRIFIHTGSVTRCISPVLAYDTWSINYRPDIW